MTPSDQMSHLRVYSILWSTCGAIQQGVPTWERSRSYSLATNLAIPKSANLALPWPSKMLAGLRSLCTIPWRSSSSHPATICLNTSTLLASPHGPCSVSPLRSSQQRSITMQTAPLSSSTSYTFTMLAWLSCVKMRTSLASRAVIDCIDRVRPEEGIFISLMAYSPSSYTLPKLPAAMTLPNWYLPFPIAVIPCQHCQIIQSNPKSLITLTLAQFLPSNQKPNHLYYSVFICVRNDDSDYGVSDHHDSANFKVAHSQCSLIDQRKVLDISIHVLIHLLVHLLQHLPQVVDQEVAGLQTTLDQGRRFPRWGQKYWFIRENWYLGTIRDTVGRRTARISLIPNIIKQYNTTNHSFRRGKGCRIYGYTSPTEKVLGDGIALRKAERNSAREALSYRKYSSQILQLLRNYRICAPQCLRYSQTWVMFNLDNLPRRRCYSSLVRSWPSLFVDLCWVMTLDLGSALLSSIKQVIRSSLLSYSSRKLSSIFASLSTTLLWFEVQLSTLLLNLASMDYLIFLCSASRLVRNSSLMLVTSISMQVSSSVFLMMIYELSNCRFAYILVLNSSRSLRHDFAQTFTWF